MIDPHLFDFPAYLSAELQIPMSTIQIEQLSGGGTNLTVRAQFQPSNHLDGPLTASIVLKYAPPFVASKPKEAMSPYRQTIEARALAFLSGQSKYPCAQSVNLGGVLGELRIPRFIRHDEAKNVLWMSDLGAPKVMPDWLVSTSTTPSQATHAGKELGRFLASLFTATRHPSSDLIDLFNNPYDRHDSPMLRNAATASRCLLEIGESAKDVEVLVERFKEAYDEPEEEERCLGISDLWMGSVLVDEEGSVALCDWEMFGESEAGSELGMLLGSIQGLVLLPSTPESARQAAGAFVNAMLSSFKMSAGSACTIVFLRRLLLGYACELVCHEDEFEGETRLGQIKALSGVLRAVGRSAADIDFTLLGEQDRRFLKEVLV